MVLAFGLMTTPGYLVLRGSWRSSPKCWRRLPEQRFESQWLKSQQAALNGGGLDPLEASRALSVWLRGVCRGFEAYFLDF